MRGSIPIGPNQPKTVNRSWVIGFTEAEGSFYITKKDENRKAHGFGITQKRNPEVLDLIRNELKIVFSSTDWNKGGYWEIRTTNATTLKYIKDYYFDSMKGMKSFEYRIWARSFKYKGNYAKLLHIQSIMRKIRKRVAAR